MLSLVDSSLLSSFARCLCLRDPGYTTFSGRARTFVYNTMHRNATVLRGAPSFCVVPRLTKTAVQDVYQWRIFLCSPAKQSCFVTTCQSSLQGSTLEATPLKLLIPAAVHPRLYLRTVLHHPVRRGAEDCRLRLDRPWRFGCAG